MKISAIIGSIGLGILGLVAVGCSAEVAETESTGVSSQALSWDDDAIDLMGDYSDPLAPVTAARAYAASCVLTKTSNGKQYMVVAGGEATIGTPSDDTFILEPTAATTSQWKKVADMDDARSRTKMIKLDATRCLIVGGFAGGTTYLNKSEIFDIDTEAWTTVTDTLTDARANLGLSACGSKFAVVGGQNNGGYLATTEVFTFNSGTPANSTWDILESGGGTDVVLSPARAFPGVVELAKPSSTNRYLYVAGGYDGNEKADFDRIEVDQNCAYVAAATALTDLPTARTEIAMFPYKTGQNRILVAAGGKDGATSVTADTRLFNPDADSNGTWDLGAWAAAPSNLGTARAGLLPVKRSNDTWATVGGYLFVTTTNTASAAEQVFDNTAGTPDWLTAGTLETPRKYHVAELVGSVIYAVGGIDAAGPTVLSSVDKSN